ncbi:g3420 [Coccomyxa viridis]|uniref:LYR motif-containing protein 9 n=1 Tax=Coccomyxa viridis TaxID=1274662 RepID=A0ABP1FPD1_9CHLO
MTTNARALYRELLRDVKRLPRNSRDYYRQYLKGAFINHGDENQPERLQQLFQGARSDADYLLTKYSKGNRPGADAQTPKSTV